MADLQLVLVTPETTLLDEPVTALRFPLYDGQIGVFPSRAPMVGRLGYGELKVTSAAGERSYFIDGGFAQVKGSTVSLLTNRAMPVADLQESEAQALLEEASKASPRTDAEFAGRDRDMVRARRMLALSRRT